MTTKDDHKDWETIIGLEIHAALNTRTKLFSAAPNRYGDEPNTNITPVCTGQPGALPVLNKEAVHKAVMLGCALNAKVATFSKFDRKSYFYPDSPRNFQITQYDEPIIIGGEIYAEVEGVEKHFAIHHIHLEDDAGTMKHFGDFSGVDYNRAGAPLVEIVSEPCIHSAKEAVAYAMGIRAILQYINASDCNMQEGSLRFDVNISVRKKGEKGFRNKVELKNLNSFSNMEKAIHLEIDRQIKEYLRNPEKQPHEVIQQATFRWDPEKKETVLMRKKEFAEDYRYFPEPDLPPIVLEEEYISKVRGELPELPRQRELRYIKDYDLKPEDAFLLVSDKPTADYFEEGLKLTKNPRGLFNWIMIEFTGRLKDTGKTILDTGIPPTHIAQLVNMIDEGRITGKIAKSVADDMLKDPNKTCQQIVKDNPDYTPMSDTGAIESIVDKVLADNQQSVDDLRAGKGRALGFLVGQVMKASQGKAPPETVNALLKKKIGID
jgi:aspartyl-tRNA(Asn)/glutamyl-tRNA(Gln) amidotransferase subunit B